MIPSVGTPKYKEANGCLDAIKTGYTQGLEAVVGDTGESMLQLLLQLFFSSCAQ
jgi:hypothetical protein